MNKTPLPVQVKALCEAHPWVRKVVLVPRVQLGGALLNAVARRQGEGAGLDCFLPRQYARQLALPAVYQSNRTELPAEGQPFLVGRLLQRLDEESLPATLPGVQYLGPTVADAVETLRLDGVSPSLVDERAGHPEAGDTFRTIATCYREYHALLDKNDLYDDAHVFRWAEDEVRMGTDVSVEETVFAVCDGTDLSGRAASFLQAVQEQGAAFYRLGAVDPEEAPPATAASRFSASAVPRGDTDSTAGSGDWHFERAVGRQSEVESVFRAILEADVPFDEVEIAYTESRPYLSRLADTAELVGVPLTVGPGRPATDTKPGKALRGFFSWIVDDYDVEILIRLLRSGLLRIHRVQESSAGAPLLEAHEAATLLAARRYEPGRDGYQRALAAAIAEKRERIEELRNKNLSTDRPQTKCDRLRQLQRVVDAVLDMAPRDASVQKMAHCAQEFLERVGPTDPAPESLPEEEHSLDQAARGVLWQKLERLRTLPFSYEASDTQLASLLRRWVDGQYVRAQHPRPGAVHVLPLESAGYSDRSHLYVVGMDGEAFSSAETERAALRDADRQALAERDDTGGLSVTADPADEMLWRARRALARHAGTRTLYTRTFDVESGEERYPSPLFLRLESEYDAKEEDTAPLGLIPSASRVCLRDRDAWLSTFRSDPADEGEIVAPTAVHHHYPWIGDGETAQAARTGPTYGEHDGLLPLDSYPDLDLFGDQPVSVSRLETLAETPFIYFLQYVLDVEPLDEPALEDEPWLTPLRRGDILHDTFERFMRQMSGASPSREDEETLYAVLRQRIDKEVARIAPRSDVEEEAARRRVRQDAKIFLEAEIEHTKDATPYKFELGFGFGPGRRKPHDVGDVVLPVGDHQLPLRGRIDRIDRGPNGDLEIWDYKTGSASSYDEEAPLQEGAHLQWALYAYALERVTGEEVRTSGYFFPTTQEMGTRISFRPAPYRMEADALLRRLNALACSGSFPMTPEANTASAWQYRGYDRLVRSLQARSRDLKDKDYPENRPTPPFLD